MNQEMTKAASLLGGDRRVAELLGVARPTVSQWRLGTHRVPEARARQLMELTGGALDFEALRQPRQRKGDREALAAMLY